MPSHKSKGGSINLTLRKRRSGTLPPRVRKLLNVVGDQGIKAIEVVRTPVESFTKRLMELISLGTYEKAVHASDYDSMFHLALVLTGEQGLKYTLDKRAVVTLVTGEPYNRPNAEKKGVSLQGKIITFSSLLKDGMARMGPERFSGYDAKNNNCQDFVLGLLEGSALLTEDLKAFVKQDALKVFQRLPSFTEKVAKVVTDIGAVADRVLEGEGSWRSFYGGAIRGKKFKSRQEVNAFMAATAAEWRKKKVKSV